MKFAKFLTEMIFVAALLAIGTIMLPLQSKAQEATKQNEITMKYSQNMEELLLAVEALHDTGIAFTMDEVTPQQLKDSYLKAITAYRRVEFIALYSDGDFVTAHINMPIEEPITPSPVDVDLEGREGLLVLGELIYDENPTGKMEPILMKTGRLLASTKKFVKAEKEKTISPQDIFAATREQMLSFYTSGISGTDASPAETAATRMAVELVSMRDYFLVLKPSQPEHEGIYPKMVEQLDRFAHFLTDNVSMVRIERMRVADEFIYPIQQDLMILEGTLKK